MLRIEGNDLAYNCAGMKRRSFVQAGLLGFGGLTMADLLRARAAQGPTKSANLPTSQPANDRAVILIWLDGGPSQLETYDPKPEAAPEYRGPFGVVPTNVPGIRLSETLPLQAKHMGKMVIIPSVHHDNGDHFAAAHWMLTGYFGSTAVNLPQMFPSVGSIISKMHGPNNPKLPAYVGVPAAESVYLFPGYQGAAYLGGQYQPFDADLEHRYLGANAKTKIGTPKLFTDAGARARLIKRSPMLTSFDTLRRQFDVTPALQNMDKYQQRATEFPLSDDVRKAFDLDAEDKKVAERYGDAPWCRYTLLARRLVEAGVTFVTVDMPHWDDHDNLKEAIAPKCATMDRAVASLLQDLQERSLLDRVLVVVMGEFGRTPKLNKGLPDLGRNIPGRDHWGNAVSVMMAGGGLKTGGVVGRTNERAEHPVDRPFKPADILATIYHQLGIDPSPELFDRIGRPIPILKEGAPIREIV